MMWGSRYPVRRRPQNSGHRSGGFTSNSAASVHGIFQAISRKPSTSDTAIHPYAGNLSPGISVSTSSKSARSNSLSAAGTGNRSETVVCADVRRSDGECPAHLFRAKSFCTAQQLMIDCLREKVERYRQKVERQKAEDDKVLSERSITVANSKQPKKKWLTKGNQQVIPLGDAKVKANIEGCPRRPALLNAEVSSKAVTTDLVLPGMCQGDLPTERGHMEKNQNAVSASSHERIRTRDYGRTRDHSTTVFGEELWAKPESKLDVPSFNARMGL